MKLFVWLTIVFLWMGWNPLTSARAQEFRVVTKVYKITGADKSEPLARSLTIFHAGKVYDHLDGIKEVTIFDPAHRQITLLSIDRQLMARVHLDEIRNLQNVARNETEKYIAELRQKPDANTEKTIAMLKFHWDPVFVEEYDEKQRRLRLTSEFVRYQVVATQRKESEIVEAYLRYADWTAQLNSVSHPTLPANPRLKLNEALLKRNLIPMEVELWADLEDNLHLKASHTIHWELDNTDRTSLLHWENMLQDRSLRKLPLEHYLQIVNGIAAGPPRTGSVKK
ncbi:MAG: hypothetical protein O2955_02185 [Planctomycetota bacterium]|nr:hypothetical protein [Planctomycetota bacterium]MDA1211292.1 hypothetical protein [Planctomycetota bacterium]